MDDLQPFSWSDYLRLAEELAQRADNSALRCAVSRAYYYVYHLALERARSNGFQASPGEGTHIQLWRTFDRSPDNGCKKLSVIALRLKQKRERADYSDYYHRIKEDVQVALQEARDFASKLEAVPVRFPRA